MLACRQGENREKVMNRRHAGTTLVLAALGTLLGLGAPAVNAQEYRVDAVALEAGESPAFSQEELDQMLAPIALYPDALLSQVLIAATYPLEVVEAARWSRRNPGLEGESATAAVADRDWDPSVKALVAFPEILARMSEDLDWTRRLGDAMLFQEEALMDSVQFLRARADAAGSLDSTEHVRVIREQKTIIIEPVETRIVHVPYYDTRVVYGAWRRPAYPPVYWSRPSPYYLYGGSGFYWSAGIHVSSGFFYSSFYWPQRSLVIVNTPRYYSPPRHRPAKRHYVPGQRWKHNPAHRRGVHYRHREVRQRYQPLRHRESARLEHRTGRDPRPATLEQRKRSRHLDSAHIERRNSAGLQTRSPRREAPAHGGRATQSSRSAAVRNAPRAQGTLERRSSERRSVNRRSLESRHGLDVRRSSPLRTETRRPERVQRSAGRASAPPRATGRANAKRDAPAPARPARSATRHSNDKGARQGARAAQPRIDSRRDNRRMR